jgi:hypothetical protein
MAEEQVWSFWVCKGCPLAAECKPESFKRAKCWGETREEAMSNLVHHLVHSSHHSIPEDEAEMMANSAEFIQEDWPQPKPAPATPTRRGAPSEKKEVARRSRSPPPMNPGRSSRSPPVQAAASKSSGSRINTRVAKEGAGPVFVEVLEHCALLMKEFKKPPPPSQLELAPAGNMKSCDILMIPAEKVKHAIDALGRGITAATHAQRLAVAAANSFSVEVEVLTDVKKTLEAIMVVPS